MPPAYERIADELRARIADGTYPPGSRLPSVRKLATSYGVSDTVTRPVYRVLVAEGIVEARPGAGYFVPERRPVRRVARTRYQLEAGHHPNDPPSTSFTADRGIGWEDYRLKKRFEWLPADAGLAGLFGVAEGTAVLVRHFVFFDRDVPCQMSRSCVLVSDVAGTPVEDPACEPWPGGTPAQMASIGLSVSRFREVVVSRLATALEAETLRLPSRAAVSVITRQFFSGDRVVEVASPIVMPGESTELEYEGNL